MKKVLGVVVAIIVIVVIIILFASGNTTAPPATNSAQATNSPNATATPAAATDSVSITNFAFNPGNITVKKGTTVTWTNKDAVAHTVTETDGQTGPKSGDLNQGQSYSFTFNTVGTFKYDCSIHPYMTGTVTVTN